ncbi:30S ribosomal protein S1 [Deltaproteobacteria bacterium]|nr:30S ribosomal protein S1 [Deltaproteobacteria bacterium]
MLRTRSPLRKSPIPGVPVRIHSLLIDLNPRDGPPVAETYPFMSTTTLNLDSPLDEVSRADFESFFNEFLNDRSVREQSVVRGTVLEVGDEFVTVDVGYKAEGVIRRSEFVNEAGEITVKVGDEIDVYLDQMGEEDGLLELSKEKADLMKAWEEISKAVERDETVRGLITSRVKGGLAVDIGVKAFLPGSQVDLRPVKNLDKLIGETHDFKIIKFNKKRGNIVLSRRVLLEREREDKKSETLKSLKVNAVMLGTIKNITDYGAFVDLGGIDGLLHITDMSYGRIQHPSEMFEVGAQIEVKVLRYDEDSGRVSLGYKQIRPDPWEDAEYKYPVGATIRGRVVSLPDYGAFVELEDGIEGLVHISEMTWNKRVKTPSKLVNIGDIVEARVLGIDLENRRISLGMRQLEQNPWEAAADKYPPGTVVRGKVRNITDFGIFIGIEDGIDGLVHVSDMSWGQRVRHPSEKYQKGDDVEARVLNVDVDNERFSLGIKQLHDDPWKSVSGRYFLGQVVNGKIVHKVDFGVFVEIEDGVEGLVHHSELANSSGDWQTTYVEGATIAAEIINIDVGDRKVSLSEKSAQDRARGGDMGEVLRKQGDSSAKFGDIMGDLSKRMKTRE